MGDDFRRSSEPAGALHPATHGYRNDVPAAPHKGLAIRAPASPASAASPAHEDESLWESVPRVWELADFKPIKKLYRGYASKVYLAEDCGKEHKQKPSGEIVSIPCNNRRLVLKVYDLLRLSPLTKYQLDREVRLHTSVQHKHIVRLVAAFTQVRHSAAHGFCLHARVGCEANGGVCTAVGLVCYDLVTFVPQS
jgi:hypothetical protein